MNRAAWRGAVALLATIGCSKEPPAWLTAGDARAPAATVNDDGGAHDKAATSDAASATPSPDGGRAPARAFGSLDAARKEGQARLLDLVATASAATKPSASECGPMLHTLDTALGVAQPKVTAETKAAYLLFAQCARHERRWALLDHLARLLVAHEPSGVHTALLARAQIGFGQYAPASIALAPFLKPGPKEADVSATAAVASCRVEDDEACSRRADDALATLRGRTGFAADDLVVEARLARAESLFRKAKLDEAIHELDAAAKAGNDKEDPHLRDACTRAKTTHLGVLTDGLHELPIAFFALVGKPTTPLGPLATARLYNFSGRQLALHVEVDVPGLTQTAAKDLAFGGKKQTIALTPALALLFDLKNVAEPQDASLSIRIVEGAAKKVALDETRTVRLLPRDRLPIFLHARGDELRRSRELAAAWVAPKSAAVLALVEAAKARAPSTSFGGAAAPTLPQAQAIWDELGAQGFAFDRGPAPATEESPIETVRTVTEVLASKGGSAREGSLVIASALAALGLEPLLVDVPGDAYVGWTPSHVDRASTDARASIVPSPAGEAIFLEVGAVGHRPFATAILRANAATVEYAGEGAFAQERAGIVALAKAMKQGIPPVRAE